MFKKGQKVIFIGNLPSDKGCILPQPGEMVIIDSVSFVNGREIFYNIKKYSNCTNGDFQHFSGEELRICNSLEVELDIIKREINGGGLPLRNDNDLFKAAAAEYIKKNIYEHIEDKNAAYLLWEKIFIAGIKWNLKQT